MRRWFLGSDDGFEQKTCLDGHVLVIHHGLWRHRYFCEAIAFKFYSAPALSLVSYLWRRIPSEYEHPLRANRVTDL